MDDMRIAFFETEDWEQAYLEQKLHGYELRFYTGPLTQENAEEVKDFEAISFSILSRIDETLLQRLPNLKMLTSRSTGFDHIDVAACRKRQITVCSVPNYGAHTVAEHTFALLLALSRQLISSVDRTKHGDFDHRKLTGFELYNKTIGIIGLGDIGKLVMQIAKGFGMHVVAYSHHPDESLARKNSIHFLELKELLAVADIVTLHIPYRKENRHLINKKNIKKFKKGSILINTARGPLVETEAIIYGLEKGILRGAGLDVLEEENVIHEERQLLTAQYQEQADYKTLYLDHVLLSKDNVIITPHNAFNSSEALRVILDVTVDNIIGFEHHQPQNIIEIVR